MSAQGGQGRLDDILTSGHVEGAVDRKQNGTISTETPQTTSPTTSPSSAVDVTCGKMGGSKDSASSRLITSPELWLPAGVKPYFQDESTLIIHADCRDILPKMPKVDLVLTDPPYGIGIAEWDTFIAPALWLTLADAPLKLVFPSIGRMFVYPEPDWVLSWVRDNSTQRNGTGGFNHWEPILLYGKNRFSKDSIRALDHGGHEFHPSVKPLYLLSWLIGQTSARTILDPFMGSGTTLVAAQALGRKSIGIEIEERYCQIAVERLRQKPLPFLDTMSHDIIRPEQGGLFDGSSTDGRDEEQDFAGEQGADTPASAASSAKRDAQTVVPRGQAKDSLGGHKGAGDMEQEGA